MPICFHKWSIIAFVIKAYLIVMFYWIVSRIILFWIMTVIRDKTGDGKNEKSKVEKKRDRERKGQQQPTHA